MKTGRDGSMIKELVSKCPELQFMPILENKTPTFKDWQKSKRDYSYDNYTHIGLVCGSISGGVEAIDIDLKYDLTGTLYKRYKLAINEANPDLLKKLTVQRTVSGGFHFIYRCSEIEGNKKLARRKATEQEQASKEKIKVLIETRGEGGYIACWPSPGYEIVFGSFDKLNTITPEERDLLFEIARDFNECQDEFKPSVTIERKQIKGLSSFEDYNERGDVVGLLESHGWSVVNQRGSKIYFKRPGDTKAKQSGNYDTSKRWFSVFSTSTQFREEVGYQPYAVFTVLECGGDSKQHFKEASKKLYELGYGDRYEEAKLNNDTVRSRVDVVSGDLSFVATPADYEGYLNSWRNGTFKMGLTTGIKALDDHFRFKENNLVVANGHDNVGKSVVIWYLSMLSSLLHGWKWIIFSSENSVGNVVKKLIEFYWCMEIKSIPDPQFQIAKKYVEDNFIIIKSDEGLYNYKDILNMTKILLQKEKYKGLLIDPYNSLKIELTSASKLSTHEYHYEALSEIKLFGKLNEIAIYINCHAVTNATRQRDNDGQPLPPLKADTEGGAKFANKADDFLTIHRKTSDPKDFNVSEIHVRKIKETETGGRVTPFDAPVKLRALPQQVGFKFEVTAGGEVTATINPVEKYHSEKRNTPAITEHVEHDDDYVPF
jgi:hypothetical protein